MNKSFSSKKNHRFVSRLAKLSVLSALSAVLSMLEGMLPELPVPGARFGLANLAVMTAIDIDGLAGGICVSVVKAGFGLITRGPTAGFMSLCGSLLSTFVMWLVYKYDNNIFGYVGVGVLGAAAHNAGQLCAAFVLMGSAVWYYVPFLLLVSTVSGSLTGVINSILLPAVRGTQHHSS
ncbi:MAG: Gx transporter family protein [Lachnospiraceae bacterium]|nr:Gx transporter family protein [Lachnospiraceae bacterium]